MERALPERQAAEWRLNGRTPAGAKASTLVAGKPESKSVNTDICLGKQRANLGLTLRAYTGWVSCKIDETYLLMFRPASAAERAIAQRRIECTISRPPSNRSTCSAFKE